MGLPSLFICAPSPGLNIANNSLPSALYIDVLHGNCLLATIAIFTEGFDLPAIDWKLDICTSATDEEDLGNCRVSSVAEDARSSVTSGVASFSL